MQGAVFPRLPQIRIIHEEQYTQFISQLCKQKQIQSVITDFAVIY